MTPRAMALLPVLRRHLLIFATLLAALPAVAEPPRLAVAVVGGLSLCGTWPGLVEKIGQKLGLEIVTVSSGPKEVVVPAFRSGRADLLLIHGSDASFGLLASGQAAPLRAWAMNEHVIVGPPDDLAHVRGAPDGAEALRRIAVAQAPFIAFRDPGSHGLVQGLWRKAGVRPGPWVVPDTTETPQAILRMAAQKRAYVVVGNIPVAFGKMPHGDLAVLLSGDPAMRRLYVVIEPGPQHPASPEKRAAARRLADYLVSPEGQADLVQADRAAGGPWIYPLPTGNAPQAQGIARQEVQVDRAVLPDAH
ncbi:hypothetical protein BH10PSE16_BH10PSE16_40990 [soil metagenome]